MNSLFNKYFKRIIIKVSKLSILIFIIFLFGIFFLVIKSFFINHQEHQSINIKINNTNINAEIALTEKEKMKGLSDRKNLDQNAGMLFIYDTPNYYTIWMKDMKFPIDIIWVDQNKKISDISKNISPNTYPQTFKPTNPVKYILEVNANSCDNNNIKIGDSVKF